MGRNERRMRIVDCGMEVRNGFLPAFFGGIGRRQEEIATYGRILWIVRFPFRNPHFMFHLAAFWPPAAMITPMMTSPVTTKRMPALTPKVLSIVSKSTRKSPAPHKPTTFALPPLTEVPPITTNAIEVRRYSSPISSDDPRK